MPVTSPPIDPEALAGLRRGEEGALERLFRDQYDSLTAEAKTVLGDDTLAALTVEKVFVRTWKERERMKTPTELASFLHQTVHEAAVQKQSRRAGLHQMDLHGHGHTSAGHVRQRPTVDAAWSQIATALHATPADAKAAAREQAIHSRHEAAVHIAATARPYAWVKPTAFTILVAVSLLGLGWWITRATAGSAIDAAIASADARVLATTQGQLAEVTLRDGSTARIAAESKLRLPKAFGNQMRALRLEGTATFNVSPGKDAAFQVRTPNATIRATGTVFSARSYPAEDVVTVRVREGQVTVIANEKERAVPAGGALAVDKNGTMREPSTQELDEALGWADGIFVVNGRTLRETLPMLKRWYALDLFLKDTSLFGRRVSMRAKLDSKAEAISSLEAGGGLVFGYEGTTMVLTDTSVAPKKEVKKK
ncbi:MAG: FecR domain-containing protein [Anaerolineae bacterium]|nr:FecR domain-containing protein [Gemmatimonadaceae bacterium]